MKKYLALLLALILVLTFAACGGEKADDKTPDSDPVLQTEDNFEKEPAPSSAAEEKTTEESPKAGAEIAFEEVIVVDNDECLIKIVDIDPDNMWGYTLQAYLENKSSEISYMFSVVTASVNGVQSDPLFASEVAPGKKENAGISFMDSTLEENGITEYTDIELIFKVYDSDDWSADDVAYETAKIYPLGEEKAVRFVRDAQAADNLIIDNEHVSVTVTGYEIDDIWGYTANLYLVNKTDLELMFSVDGVSVNGYMADPFYATSVYPEKSAFSSMYWSDETFAENGITEVEEIEFTFTVYDYNDWSADNLVDQVITLNP